jgi:hypothetical protein
VLQGELKRRPLGSFHKSQGYPSLTNEGLGAVATSLRIRSSQPWAARSSASERGCDEDSEGVQGFRDELVVGPFASLLAGEDAGVDEDFQVVGDGRLGETHRVG